MVKSFLLYLDQINTSDISAISNNHISGYIKTMIGWSQRAVGDYIGGIKHFLKFLFNGEYIASDITLGMPKINNARTRRLPAVFSDDEIKSLLMSVDRANPIGKRNYAILLLVMRLGLRNSDITNLKFENINWQKCTLEIIQSKTQKPLELPLSEEIGSAIIDYLKYGRPKHNTLPYIFVRHRAPHEQIVNYYDMLQRYFFKAQIKIDRSKPHGLHALRHTLATRLLEKEIPLQTICEILGHKSPNSTNVYLKIDINRLRDCALSPEEVFVND